MLAELVLACKEHLKHANSLASADTNYHDNRDDNHNHDDGATGGMRVSPTVQGGGSGGAGAGAGMGMAKKGPCTDPAVVKNFYSRLDGPTRAMINKQATVQQFYESRIASLERYVAFCVMFHAMASTTARYEWRSNPWIFLHVPWKWFAHCCGCVGWSAGGKTGPRARAYRTTPHPSVIYTPPLVVYIPFAIYIPPLVVIYIPSYICTPLVCTPYLTCTTVLFCRVMLCIVFSSCFVVSCFVVFCLVVMSCCYVRSVGVGRDEVSVQPASSHHCLTHTRSVSQRVS